MDKEKLKLILGSPGCGKTTRLLEIVETEMAGGVPADRIAFVTFTKAAANEAAERASSQFSLDPEKDLPWFRTIHSLAYKQLGMTRDEVMSSRDWKEFSEVVREPISGFYDIDTPVASGKRGDVMLRIVDYASTTMQSLEDAWHELDEPIDWYSLKRFDAAFLAYKADVSKMDFTDMLTTYYRSGDALQIEVAVIDEAQDLTPAQWAAVYKAFSHCKRIYVGGDDDQAIYRWAGADVDHFLTLSEAPEVLHLSHRLPRSIFNLSQQVASRISRRYSKPCSASDREGRVEYHIQPDGIDLTSGTWLLLARNTYMLGSLTNMVRDQGYPYRTRAGDAVDKDDLVAMKLWEAIRQGKHEEMTAAEVRVIFKAIDKKPPQLRELKQYLPGNFPDWPLEKPWYDALEGIDPGRRDFYTACLRRGQKLSVSPRIRIETIHGVKGAESDHVLLMTDLSHKTLLSYTKAPDHEHRVFYVGMTRARESLHIVSPQSDRAYPI